MLSYRLFLLEYLSWRNLWYLHIFHSILWPISTLSSVEWFHVLSLYWSCDAPPVKDWALIVIRYCMHGSEQHPVCMLWYRNYIACSVVDFLATQKGHEIRVRFMSCVLPQVCIPMCKKQLLYTPSSLYNIHDNLQFAVIYLKRYKIPAEQMFSKDFIHFVGSCSFQDAADGAVTFFMNMPG